MTPTLVERIRDQEGGSVFAFNSAAPDGFLVALTDQRVDGDIIAGLREVQRLACDFARLNQAIRERLVIGWYRDDGELYVDLGLSLPSGSLAFGVAEALAQRSLAVLDRGRLQIVPVSVSVSASAARVLAPVAR